MPCFFAGVINFSHLKKSQMIFEILRISVILAFVNPSLKEEDV